MDQDPTRALVLLQHNFKFNSVLFLNGIVKIFVSNTHKIKHDFLFFSRPSRQRKLDELKAVQQQKLQAQQRYRLQQQQHQQQQQQQQQPPQPPQH